MRENGEAGPEGVSSQRLRIILAPQPNAGSETEVVVWLNLKTE